MFLRDKIAKVVENSHDQIKRCFDTLDKIDEMFGGIPGGDNTPDKARLEKMRVDARTRVSDQLAIIIAIMAPFCDEIRKHNPYYIDEFQEAEKLVFGGELKIFLEE